MAGVTLPHLRRRATAAQNAAVGPSAGQAKSCILVYLLGGPPHLDTFDLKPEAPSEIRGPFRPIPTTVPGFQVCEHLPRLASMAHKYSVIRSVTHANSNHTPMIYYTLTGHHVAQPGRDNDIRPPLRTDFPHLGSIVAQQKPSPIDPGYVAIPEVAIRSSIEGEYKRARLPLRGGNGGFLGPRYDPFTINDAPGENRAVPSLTLPPAVREVRFERRRALLDVLDRGTPAAAAMREYDTFRDMAVTLTGQANDRRSSLFSVDTEPPRIRERYGRHRFGTTLLLARRLAEAGVPMVAVHFNEMTVCDGWDTHSKNFEALKSELLPLLDQGLSALIEDLEQRELLPETLVACFGEFGRTPKINRNAGRDHWGPCSSTLLTGGGIQGGRVLGASDATGALPTRDLVDPVDVHATLYHCLGLEAEQTIHDHRGRPYPISSGRVIDALL